MRDLFGAVSVRLQARRGGPVRCGAARGWTVGAERPMGGCFREALHGVLGNAGRRVRSSDCGAITVHLGRGTTDGRDVSLECGIGGFEMGGSRRGELEC